MCLNRESCYIFCGVNKNGMSTKKPIHAKYKFYSKKKCLYKNECACVKERERGGEFVHERINMNACV